MQKGKWKYVCRSHISHPHQEGHKTETVWWKNVETELKTNSMTTLDKYWLVQKWKGKSRKSQKEDECKACPINQESSERTSRNQEATQKREPDKEKNQPRVTKGPTNLRTETKKDKTKKTKQPATNFSAHSVKCEH